MKLNYSPHYYKASLSWPQLDPANRSHCYLQLRRLRILLITVKQIKMLSKSEFFALVNSNSSPPIPNDPYDVGFILILSRVINTSQGK